MDSMLQKLRYLHKKRKTLMPSECSSQGVLQALSREWECYFIHSQAWRCCTPGAVLGLVESYQRTLSSEVSSYMGEGSIFQLER